MKEIKDKNNKMGEKWKEEKFYLGRWKFASGKVAMIPSSSLVVGREKISLNNNWALSLAKFFKKFGSFLLNLIYFNLLTTRNK